MATARFFKAILVTGLIAGLLDLSGAVISYLMETGHFPNKILEYIAGGAFGPGALDGGLKMKLWGLFFHFFIAVFFTYFYFLVYPKLKLLQVNIILSAVMYGIFVWVVMNMGVLPLSAYHTPVVPVDIKSAAKGAFILIICIGFPVALGTRTYYSSLKTY